LAIYHVGGFSLIMRALIAGGRIIFPQPSQPLADALMHPDVTHVSLVPTQLLRLLDQPGCVHRLKRLKAILLGGDGIPPALLDHANACGLPVCTTYGATEAASQIATSAPGRPREGAKVLPYRELKIAPDGEICIKGKTLFKGYVYAATTDPASDAEGWFHTGDIGTLDVNGTLHVTGRKDLMFISGGENIHPEEIERVLMSLENVEQAVVVPVKDAQFTHRPAAFIRTRNNTPLDPEKIKAELKTHLEPFKIPKTFHSWPDCLPDSPKPLRKQLAGLASDA
jgi:O-succinylbenzoic acid--CoA ligase